MLNNIRECIVCYVVQWDHVKNNQIKISDQRTRSYSELKWKTLRLAQVKFIDLQSITTPKCHLN